MITSQSGETYYLYTGWPQRQLKLLQSFKLVIRSRLRALVTLSILQAGKLYLLPPYICFCSLDHRSVRFAIPLACIRCVERLNTRSAGPFALSFVLWHGTKLVVQLTSLRPTADMFCTHLRDTLKVQLNLGKMKVIKGFAKTCYSKTLMPNSGKEGAEAENGEGEDGSLLTDTGEVNGTPLVEAMYQGGLGLMFKFPSDAKKRMGSFLCQTHNPNAVL